MPHWIDLYQQYHDKGLEILLISDEPLERLQAFVNGIGLPFPVLSDRKRQVFDDYGVNGIPFTLLVDRQGKIASGLPGYSPSGLTDDFIPVVLKTINEK